MPKNSAVATRCETIVPLKLMIGIIVIPMVMNIMTTGCLTTHHMKVMTMGIMRLKGSRCPAT